MFGEDLAFYSINLLIWLHEKLLSLAQNKNIIPIEAFKFKSVTNQSCKMVVISIKLVQIFINLVRSSLRILLLKVEGVFYFFAVTIFDT